MKDIKITIGDKELTGLTSVTYDKHESYLLSLDCNHNARCRYTHGYQCEDCNRFIKKDTLEYFMTEGYSDIWMALHNRGTKGVLHNDLNALKIKLATFNNDYIKTLTEKEAEIFMTETYGMLSIHNVLDTEATVTLK